VKVALAFICFIEHINYRFVIVERFYVSLLSYLYNQHGTTQEMGLLAGKRHDYVVLRLKS